MRTKLLLGALAFLVACAFVAPAGAMNIGGTDYVLFGQTAVKMEDGPVTIDGNVAVNDVGGLLRIGAHNQIQNPAHTATVTADKMFFGTAAKVDICQFNTSTGGAPAPVCGNIPPDPIPPGAAIPVSAWPPAPVPVVPVNNSNKVCPANGALALAPGTYGELDVRDGCVLTLSAGTYNFKKVRLQTGSETNGNGATVNVKGSIVTERAVTINQVTMTSINAGTFEAIVIGNASVLNDVVLYAPNAQMHLHQGGVYTNFEGVAVFIRVEPITITSQAQGCGCVGTITKSGDIIQLTDGCGLNNALNTYFVDTVCEACPGGAGCNGVTPVGGSKTATSINLNIPGALPAGAYHVIVNSPAGSFCTANTLNLP